MSDPFNGEVPWPWLLEIANEVWEDYTAHPEKYTIREERNPSMLSFSELKAKAEEIAHEVESHAASIFHQGVADLAKEVQDVVAKAKSDALVIVKNDTPEIQAAVQAALDAVEKAVLAAIESRLV